MLREKIEKILKESLNPVVIIEPPEKKNLYVKELRIDGIAQALTRILALIETEKILSMPNANGCYYDQMNDCFVNQMGDRYEKI